MSLAVQNRNCFPSDTVFHLPVVSLWISKKQFRKGKIQATLKPILNDFKNKIKFSTEFISI